MVLFRQLMKKIPVIVFFLLCLSLHSQTLLTGRIYYKNEPVTDARVEVIKKSTQQSLGLYWTDLDGYYKFRLKNLGEKDTLIIQVAFLNIAEVSDTLLITAEEYFHPVFLNKQKMVKITGNIKTDDGSTLASVRLQKSATNILDILSIEEFRKTGRINSVDMLKRMPGVTVLDGKFAIVRGMNDRYNSGYLNGSPVPNSESDRKAFSFESIPAALIDNMMVYKSGQPNLSGDFGGGIFKITTKSIPDKKLFVLSLGHQYNSLTGTGKIEQYNFGDMARWGLIDKAGQIPQLDKKLNGSAVENLKETQKFNNNWGLQSVSANYAPVVSATLGLPIKLKKRSELGLIASFNYSITPKYTYGNVKSFNLSDNRILRDFNDQIKTFTVQNGGIFNVSYKLNSRHRFDFKNFYNINYEAASTFRNGLSDADDQKYTNSFAMNAVQNRLLNTQLSGSHNFFVEEFTKQELIINWNANFFNINRLLPDYRIAEYTLFDTMRQLAFNNFFNSGSGRFFSSMNEKAYNAAIDLTYKIDLEKSKSAIKTGLFTQNRNRLFESRRFVYGPQSKTYYSNHLPGTDLSFENLSNNGIYLIEKTSPDIDEYQGTVNLYAGYFMLENEFLINNEQLKLTKTGKISLGFRFEEFNQVITNEEFKKLNRTINTTKRVTDILPSLNLLLPLSKKFQLRPAYSKSVNRPEMRENAPFAYYSFNSNSEIIGNPDLKRAEIHNFDLRLEYYSGLSGIISVSGFRKRIINPIEVSLDPTQPGIRTFTYNNQQSADLQGIEMELRQNLGLLLKSKTRSILNYLDIYSNIALISSRISLAANSQGTPNRPLQGQSPYVFNSSIFYESEKGFVFNVSFNKIGDRIAYIGTKKSVQPFGLDIYEKGRSVLDVQIGKNFGKQKNHQLRLNLLDLLKQNSRYYQDINGNKKFDAADNLVIDYHNGYGLILNYTLVFN